MKAQSSPAPLAIRHVVLFRIRADVSDARLHEVLEELRNLSFRISGITGFCAGADVSVESMARSYTHAFTLDFTGQAARDAYLAHPLHARASASLLSIVTGGIDGVLVLDFAVPGHTSELRPHSR